MTDARRRRLEREAEAEPGALEARRALAHELARAGDRRGHLAVVAGLARAGDLDAQRALDALAPHPCFMGLGGTGNARVAPLAGTPRVTRGAVELDLPALRVDVSERTLLWVTAPGKSKGKGRNLCAIDAAALRPRWSERIPRAQPATSALIGDDVLVATGRTVELLAAEDGARLARLRLPFDAGRVVVTGDRALISGGDALACLDPLAGRALWTAPADGRQDVRVSGGHVATTRGGEPVVLRLEDGAPLDIHALTPRALDARGLVGIDDRGRLEEVDLAGSVRWRIDEAVNLLVLGDDVALAQVLADRRLLAIDRATGRELWRAPGPPCYAAAGGLAYRVEGTRAVALDLATGSPRLEVELGPVVAHAERAPQTVPLAGGLLVTFTRGTTLHLVRLESN